MSMKTLAISAGILALSLLPVLAQEAPKTLDDEHKQLYENVCGSCHDPNAIVGEPRDREAWYYVVDRMVEMGATGSDEELDQIVDYLAKYYGMPVYVNTAEAEEFLTLGLTEDQARAVVAAREKTKFPDFEALSAIPALKDVKLDGLKHRMVFPKPLPQDPNRQTYLNTCGACHSVDIVVGVTHSRESWGKLVGRMRDHGANGTDDDFKKITDYLATYFGQKSSAPEAAPNAAGQ